MYTKKMGGIYRAPTEYKGHWHGDKGAEKMLGLGKV